jgi:nicotinamidase-related amidase
MHLAMTTFAHGPSKNEDLNGNVPDESPVVLLVIDVINDLEFEGGDDLLEAALPMARRLASLTSRARAARVPIIYVNDNFGKWRTDFRHLLEHCLNDGVRGAELARLLRPLADDYFVLKPKHSAFFSTPLDTLLTYLKARTVILTGLTTDSCVLATAIDADIRDLRVVVPEDCVAALTSQRHARSLEHLAEVLDATILASSEIDFAKLSRRE